MMLLGTSYAHLHHDCFQPNDPFLGCKERTYVDLGRSGPVVIYSFGLFSVRSVSSASRVVLEKDSVASSFEYPHVQVSMYPSQVARHVIVCLWSSLTPATMIFAGPPPVNVCVDSLRIGWVVSSLLRLQKAYQSGWIAVPMADKNTVVKPHFALAIYDVVLAIFEQLSPIQSANLSSSNARDLRTCALVCRAWAEPALCTLWSDVPSLFPLWHLLAPPDLPYPRWSSSKPPLETKYFASVILHCVDHRRCR